MELSKLFGAEMNVESNRRESLLEHPNCKCKEMNEKKKQEKKDEDDENMKFC